MDAQKRRGVIAAIKATALRVAASRRVGSSDSSTEALISSLNSSNLNSHLEDVEAVPTLHSPFVPTPESVVATFLSSLEAGDTVLDIGCGDGRVCIAAVLAGHLVHISHALWQSAYACILTAA